MSDILIVDDEPGILRALRRELTADGHDVTAFTDGEAALLAAQDRPFDLVLSDHRMPIMDGVTFLKRMRETQPDTIRLILTGCADLHAVIGAINDAEIYRFLTKPWNDLDLKVTIKQALAHRDLLLENRRLADEVRRQQETLESLEARYPGIGHVKRASDGAVIIEEADL